MPTTIKKRDDSSVADLTILLTLTSTYTISTPSSTSSKKSVSSQSSTGAKKTSANMFLEESSSATTKISSEAMSTTFKTVLITSTSTSASSSTSNEVKTSNISTEDTSSNYIGSMDNVSGSNSSLKLGLSIGIPTSVVGLFLLIILGFIYYKKKNGTNKNEKIVSYKSEFFNMNNESLTKFENATLRSDSNEKLNQFRNDVDARANAGPERSAKRHSMKLYLKDRLSKVINIRDINEIGTQPQTVKSPILRKFNLTRPPLSRMSSPQSQNFRSNKTNSFISRIEPQFLPIPYSDSKLNSNSSKYKTLPKLPQIISTHNPSSLSKMENFVESGNELEKMKPTVSVNKLCLIMRPYKKNMDDEIDISVGERAYILKEHSDGWCKIRLVPENKDGASAEGLVPKLCLKELMDSSSNT